MSKIKISNINREKEEKSEKGKLKTCGEERKRRVRKEVKHAEVKREEQYLFILEYNHCCGKYSITNDV